MLNIHNTSIQDSSSIVSRFLRDGVGMLPGLLGADECAVLRELVDAVFAEPTLRESRNVNNSISACRLFELSPLFLNLASHPALVGIASKILGEDFHLIAQNVLRTSPGQIPFSSLWHTDEPLLFPLPDDVGGHSANINMPVYWFVVHIALSDIDTPDKGPTQYIPTSHYSGRRAPADDAPMYRGNGPRTALADAGDAYLHNSQCWHRATPNRSDSTRYLLQNVYGARFVSHWFYPYVNYSLPQNVVETATEQQLRLLGRYESGPFS